MTEQHPLACGAVARPCVRIYVASKTEHARRWTLLRSAGAPITCTWIDEAGQGETKSFSDLWVRCVREASEATALILYHEPNEVLKGAFVEVGCALALGVPVLVVGDPPGSFVKHPLVKRFADVRAAFIYAGFPEELYERAETLIQRGVFGR